MKLTLVILVILLGRISDAHTCNEKTQYELHNLCCDKCPPRQFVKRHCTAYNQTVCEPCQAGTFTKTFSSKSECDTCPTNQYYDINLSFCMDCKKCPKGEYPLEQCSITENTVCQKCPEGHFSNVTENYQLPCIACTKCTRYRANCTKESDAVCEEEIASPPAISTSTDAWTILQSTILMQTTKEVKPVIKKPTKEEDNTFFILAVVLSVVFVVALLVIYYCTRRKARCQTGETIGRRTRSVKYQPLQTGLLLRNQPAAFFLKLVEYLNPDGRPNWKDLAGAFGDFSYDEIANFAVDKGNAAEKMLCAWQVKNTATVDKLYHCLMKIKREDVATYVANFVSATAGSVV